MTNWFGVSTTPNAGQAIPPNVKWSFYAGGFVFFLAVLLTVLRTREYSPEALAAFEEASGDSAEEADDKGGKTERVPRFFRSGILWLLAGVILSFLFYWWEVGGELYILSFGLLGFGIIQLITHAFHSAGKEDNGLVIVLTDLFNMTGTMVQLAFVQFFSWFALFVMWICTTAGLTSHIYGTSDTASALYNEGANWVGILFAVYNGFATIAAFLVLLVRDVDE